MKFKLLTITILLCGLLSACKDDKNEEADDLLYGLNHSSYVFTFIIQDKDGHNIFDKGDGAVEVDDVSISFNGAEYKLASAKPQNSLIDNVNGGSYYGLYCAESQKYGTVVKFGELDIAGEPKIAREQEFCLKIGERTYSFRIKRDVVISDVYSAGLNPEDSPYRITWGWLNGGSEDMPYLNPA